MHKLKVFWIFFCCTCSAFFASYYLQASSLAPQRKFQIEKRWHPGGEGGWGQLLLDSTIHRLYIPRSERVLVIDTDTGNVSGEVLGFIGAHDIAFDDKGKFAYVSDLTDGSAGFVRVFDRTTLKITASISVGGIPDSIVFDPVTKNLFVFDESRNIATTISSETNRTIGTMALPGRPGPAVTNGKGEIFVAMRGLSTVLRIDSTSQKVENSWPLAPCVGPSGIATDNTRSQILVTCENGSLVALNENTGKSSVIGNTPKGSGNIRFDTLNHLIFVSNDSGVLTVFRQGIAAKALKLQEVAISPGLQTLEVDPQKHAVYVATSKFGQRTGAVSEELRYRPTPLAGTFVILVLSRR